MKKIEINSKNLYKIIPWILTQRSIFLVVFVGAMLIYSFDVIYKNAYIKLEYIDYSNSAMIFDGKKENVMITRITSSLKQREDIIRDGLEKEYRNIFVFEDTQEEIYDKNSEMGIYPEGPVSEGSAILPAEVPETINNGNSGIVAGPDVIPGENVQ